MKKLGAKSLVSRHDVDQEDRSIILTWFDLILQSLNTVQIVTSLDYLDTTEQNVEDSGFNRVNPFKATLEVYATMRVI